MADAKISALTNYTSPQDADVLPIVDTANTSTKKITWANIKATLNSLYQATLVSGTNIKTVNSTSLLGSGNVAVQETLVSGTNIKTINSTSILGSGDIAISGSVADGDKGDIVVSGSGATWTIDSAVVGVSKLSASGTPSGSTFLRGDNTWATPAGSGDVSKVGTPVNNQVGVWTGDGTIEGDSALTFDTTTDTLAIGASGKLAFGAVNILSDAAGTTTLSNIDALDATTEATIEAAIDTLANLTSIQGNTITVSGASTINQNVSTTGNPQFTTIELGAASDTTISRTGAGAIAVEGVGVALNSTSLAHTASQYEVGNASDTTITRSSAGVIAVEGVAVPTISSTSTLTNKRMQPRTASSTTASTLTPDLATANVYYRTTQTATLTIDAPTGTPVIGETIMIYVDSAGAQTLTINSTYKAFGAAFPAATTAGKTFMMSAQYNGTDWKTLWANAV